MFLFYSVLASLLLVRDSKVQKNIKQREISQNLCPLGKGHRAHEGGGTNCLVKLVIKLSLLSPLHCL